MTASTLREDGRILTVVTIVRNNPEVATTLDSLGRQPRGDWDLLVIDGCSTDGTSELIHERMHSLDLPGRHVREPDRGISDALNKGVRMADGTWIMFLNGGDALHQDADLSVLAGSLARSNADVVCGAALMEGAGRRFVSPGDWKRLDDPAYFWNPVCHQATFFRRAFHQRFRYDETLRYTMDLDLLLRMRSAGAAFETIPDMVCLYRIGGLTSSDAHYLRNHREHDLVNRRNGRTPPPGRSASILARNLLSMFARRILGERVTRSVRRRTGRA